MKIPVSSDMGNDILLEKNVNSIAMSMGQKKKIWVPIVSQTHDLLHMDWILTPLNYKETSGKLDHLPGLHT